MPLRTACTSCGKNLQIREELAGKRVKCPACGSAFVAAAASTAVKAAPKAAAPPPAPSTGIKAKTAPPSPVVKKPAAHPMDDDDIEDLDESALKPTVMRRPTRKDEDDEDEDDREERRPRPQVKSRAAARDDDEDDEDFDDEDDAPRHRKRRKVAARSNMMWVWIGLGGVGLVGIVVAVILIFFRGSTNQPLAQGGNQGGGGRNQAGGAVGGVPLADLVPGDSLFFLSVSGDLWNAAALAPARQKIEQEAENDLRQKLGLGMADIGRISLCFLGGVEDLKNIKGDPPMAGIFQTRKPMNEPQVRAAMQNQPGKQVELEFVNPQTLIISNAMPRYKERKGKTKASGVLERALTHANTSSGVVASITIPPGAIQQAAGPALQGVPPFVHKLQGVFATLDLTDRLQLQASLVMEDAAAAAEGKKLLDQSLAQAVGMIGFMVQDKQVQQLAQQAIKEIRIAQQDKDVQIIYSTDAANVANALTNLLQKVQGVQGAAATMEGMNNLKQIGLAMHMYHDRFKQFPPQTFQKGLSWRVALLPYLEQDTLFNQFKLEEPWDSPHNKALIPHMPKVFEIPGRAAGPGRTFLQAFLGPKTSNPEPQKPSKLASFIDGTSNTIIVAEAAQAVEWTRPEDVTVDPNRPIQLGNPIQPRFLALFADGRVEQVVRGLDQKILRNLIDPADRTAIDLSVVTGGKK